ncbi:Ig-like domain-containing protein [Schumannella luteola]
MDRHARRRLSDEDLAERARSGDAESFAELWERHARPGHTAARHFSSIADPEDIVAEAYLRILGAIQRGGGPREAFRPYLYRTIRNVALGWRAAPAVPLDDVEEVADDSVDVETSVVESTITVRAFRSLPERWQTVLWYTEVEGMEVADVAPLMGLTPANTAALAYRARDGLRKAWVQAHVSDLRVPAECRWTTERMGEYARGGLTPRARARFDAHLATCARCSILLEEVDAISGRLAAFLLPTVLGGAVAAQLIAQFGPGGASPAAAAAPPRVPRSGSTRAALAAATVVVVAGAATVVLAATGVLAPPERPATDAAAPAPSPSASIPVPPPSAPPTSPPEDPSPEPTQPPEPPPPGTPPATPVDPAPPPPPPDTIPPARPVVFSPLDAELTALNLPAFTGAGEPGARIEVSADGLGVIASTVVAADGSWSTTAVTALPDGTRQLVVTQVDRAGNRSPLTALSIVVDTVALPPITSLPVDDALYFLPTLSGTAEPDAIVDVVDETGAAVGQAQATSDGTWSLPVPDPGRDGQRLQARQTDLAGNVSELSEATPALVFERPSILAPVDGAVVPAVGGSASVTVTIDGTAGMLVQILLDGTPTGNIHTLGASPIDRVTPPLPVGAHTVAVRYYSDDATVGSLTTVSFVVGE